MGVKQLLEEMDKISKEIDEYFEEGDLDHESLYNRYERAYCELDTLVRRFINDGKIDSQRPV